MAALHMALSQADRERLKKWVARRAIASSRAAAKEYYVGACRQLKAEGRMTAEEYTECLDIIGVDGSLTPTTAHDTVKNQIGGGPGTKGRSQLWLF